MSLYYIDGLAVIFSLFSSSDMSMKPFKVMLTECNVYLSQCAVVGSKDSPTYGTLSRIYYRETSSSFCAICDPDLRWMNGVRTVNTRELTLSPVQTNLLRDGVQRSNLALPE